MNGHRYHISSFLEKNIIKIKEFFYDEFNPLLPYCPLTRHFPLPLSFSFSSSSSIPFNVLTFPILHHRSSTSTSATLLPLVSSSSSSSPLSSSLSKSVIAFFPRSFSTSWPNLSNGIFKKRHQRLWVTIPSLGRRELVSCPSLLFSQIKEWIFDFFLNFLGNWFLDEFLRVYKFFKID